MVAFRGTPPTEQKPNDLEATTGINVGPNWRTDLALGQGVNIKNIPEMRDALKFAESVQQQYGNVTYTGHSLGGAMAQYAATEFKNSHAIAFDAAPLGASLLAAQENVGSLTAINSLGPASTIPLLQGKLPEYGNITNFNGPMDPVTGQYSAVSKAFTGTTDARVIGKTTIVKNAATNSDKTDDAQIFNHSIVNLAVAMTNVQRAEPYISGAK